MKHAMYIRDVRVDNCRSLWSSFLEIAKFYKMMFKIAVIYALLFIFNNESHIVRRDVTSTSQQPNVLEPFLKNIEEFKKCLDQSLAKTVSQVNEKQLQPIFEVTGDALNRVSKAFDDLTAPVKKIKQDDFE